VKPLILLITVAAEAPIVTLPGGSCSSDSIEADLGTLEITNTVGGQLPGSCTPGAGAPVGCRNVGQDAEWSGDPRTGGGGGMFASCCAWAESVAVHVALWTAMETGRPLSFCGGGRSVTVRHVMHRCRWCGSRGAAGCASGC
jgi:hypothetical protein